MRMLYSFARKTEEIHKRKCNGESHSLVPAFAFQPVAGYNLLVKDSRIFVKFYLDW